MTASIHHRLSSLISHIAKNDSPTPNSFETGRIDTRHVMPTYILNAALKSRKSSPRSSLRDFRTHAGASAHPMAYRQTQNIETLHGSHQTGTGRVPIKLRRNSRPQSPNTKAKSPKSSLQVSIQRKKGKNELSTLVTLSPRRGEGATRTNSFITYSTVDCRY